MFFPPPWSDDQKAIVIVIESPKWAKVPFSPVNLAWTFFMASTHESSAMPRSESASAAVFICLSLRSARGTRDRQLHVLVVRFVVRRDLVGARLLQGDGLFLQF